MGLVWLMIQVYVYCKVDVVIHTVIPALRKLRQEDYHKFKTILGYSKFQDSLDIYSYMYDCIYQDSISKNKSIKHMLSITATFRIKWKYGSEKT